MSGLRVVHCVCLLLVLLACCSGVSASADPFVPPSQPITPEVPATPVTPPLTPPVTPEVPVTPPVTPPVAPTPVPETPAAPVVPPAPVAPDAAPPTTPPAAPTLPAGWPTPAPPVAPPAPAPIILPLPPLPQPLPPYVPPALPGNPIPPPPPAPLPSGCLTGGCTAGQRANARAQQGQAVRSPNAPLPPFPLPPIKSRRVPKQPAVYGADRPTAHSGPVNNGRWETISEDPSTHTSESLRGDHVGMGGGSDGPWIPSDSGLPMLGEEQGAGSKFRVSKGVAARPHDVEDCVACRYIWLLVEADAGAAPKEEVVYASFNKHCTAATHAQIFQPSCQDMHAQVDDMIGDYMDGYTINQLCENARLCRV